MGIKVGNTLREVHDIHIGVNGLIVGHEIFITKDATEAIAKQLLEKGYADLTHYVDEEVC